MPLSSSLIPARRHLAFVLGLALAVGVAFSLDQSVRAPNALADLKPAAEPKLAEPKPVEGKLQSALQQLAARPRISGTAA